MKSKNLIIGIMFFIMVYSAFASYTPPLYSDHEWGNTNWISESATRTLTSANNTYCQPFEAYETGTVKKIFAHISNSGAVVNWCLSNTLSYPNTPITCTGNGGTFSGVGVGFSEYGQNVTFPVTRGNTYFLCVQGDTSFGGSATINVGNSGYYANDDATNFTGITTPYDTTLVEGYQPDLNAYYSYEIAGAYTGFSESQYAFRNLQYCMDNAGDECYIYTGTSDNNADGEGLNEMSGQFFQYKPTTSSLQEVNFMMMHGTGIAGYTYKVEVYDWNQTTNTTGTLLYNSTAIPDNNGTWTTGYLWSNHTVTAPFNLIHNNYYLVGARCVSGCSGSLNQKMHLAYMNWRTTNDWFVMGFQGDAGARYDENVAGDHIEVSKDTFFLLKMGDVVRETLPEANVTAPQCNDSIDNDGDGWTDYPFDPQCDNYTDINESPYDYDCNDGYDNDGDYYFDYPSDPSCSGLTDDDESPFDYPQCNDGIDNDFDGYTDYPSDPSCSSASDNTESPADASIQEEDECLISLSCLIYDSIPYSDSPFEHGWYGGQESDVHTVSFLGGYSIDLDTVDDLNISENVIMYKNISHPNDYNYLYGQFIFAINQVDPFSTLTEEPVIFGFYDVNDNPLVMGMLNVSVINLDGNDVIEANLYVYDLDHWEYVEQLITDSVDNGYIQVEFNINALQDTFTVAWEDFFGEDSSSLSYDYASGGFGKIYKAIVSNTIDPEDAQVLLNLVELKGTDENSYDTVCTTWVLPYHLKENFNGYMSECGWNVYPDIFMWSKLQTDNEISDFLLYKIFDEYEDEAIYYDRSRYATVTFDYKPYDDSDSDYVTNLFLYDLAFENAFIRIYFKTNGDVKATVDGNSYSIMSGMTMNTSKQVMIVLDLLEDNFDFYYDGVLKGSNVDFYNKFLNVEYFNGIYLQSAESHYELDNLEVYESDEEGTPVPSVQTPTETPDEDKLFCELMTKVEQSCSSDSDCATGKCQLNNKCSKFDFTYCDENGYTRGNKCLIAGVSMCVFSSAGDIILDNFFLFLIGLVLMMIIVYLVIMMRN